MSEFEITEIQRDLLRKNIMDISGEVNDKMALYVRHCILYLMSKDCPDITVYFTSRGGRAEIGFVIYDAIKNYKGKTTGIVAGLCCSAALTILQACNVRQSHRHSKFLFHNTVKELCFTADDFRNTEKNERLALELDSSEKKKYDIFKTKLKIERDELKILANKNQEINAERALEIGFIDEIV